MQHHQPAGTTNKSAWCSRERLRCRVTVAKPVKYSPEGARCVAACLPHPCRQRSHESTILHTEHAHPIIVVVGNYHMLSISRQPKTTGLPQLARTRAPAPAITMQQEQKNTQQRRDPGSEHKLYCTARMQTIPNDTRNSNSSIQQVQQKT